MAHGALEALNALKVATAHGGRWRAMTVVKRVRANRVYAGAGSPMLRNR